MADTLRLLIFFAALTAFPAQSETSLASRSSGSGFFVSASGYLVTNHHVVENCDRVFVQRLDGPKELNLVAHDETNDLAVLKTSEPAAHFYAVSRSNPQILDEIFVAGFPFGEAVSSSVKVTKGIVSALSGIRNNYSEMQIDAALQPGNSGGPIINADGIVVGVAVSTLALGQSLQRFGVVPQGTNFGVKASALNNLLEANSIQVARSKNVDADRDNLKTNIMRATALLSCQREQVLLGSSTRETPSQPDGKTNNAPRSLHAAGPPLPAGFLKGDMRLKSVTILNSIGLGWKSGGDQKEIRGYWRNGEWRKLAAQFRGHAASKSHYYMLGRAAEELGSPKAAETYYELALALPAKEGLGANILKFEEWEIQAARDRLTQN